MMTQVLICRILAAMSFRDPQLYPLTLTLSQRDRGKRGL
jgi:hypothetical protein